MLDPKFKKQGIRPQQSLQDVLDHSLAQRIPDVLFVTGDIAAEPHPEVYRRFRDFVRERYSGPMLCVPGNHDDGAMLAACLPTESIAVQTWRFVGIDTHVDGKLSGNVAPNELKRLEKELQENEDPAIVIGHHHPLEIRSAWMDRHRIHNSDEVLCVLARHSNCRAYVFGHVHQMVDQTRGAIRILGTPSTCWQFLPRVDEFGIDDERPGWRWLYCNRDGSIKTTIERLA